MISLNRALALVAVLATIPFSGGALARDRFVGDWTKECAPSLQCWAEISRSARTGGYVFEYFAASRYDAKDVACRMTATLKRSRSRLVAISRDGDEMRIDPGPDGGIRVTGAGSCKGNDVSGFYGALGDI